MHQNGNGGNRYSEGLLLVVHAKAQELLTQLLRHLQGFFSFGKLQSAG
jgi:hypothetical protein